MKPDTQLDRLVTKLKRLGVLVDGLESPCRCDLSVLTFPRLFDDLIRTHLFVAFVVGGVLVHSNLCDEENNFDSLFGDKFLTGALCRAGFTSFGRPSNGSYDRVCFDMRSRKRPFDAPIVVMDHETILSHNRIPKPQPLVSGIVSLFEMELE